MSLTRNHLFPARWAQRKRPAGRPVELAVQLLFFSLVLAS